MTAAICVTIQSKFKLNLGYCQYERTRPTKSEQSLICVHKNAFSGNASKNAYYNRNAFKDDVLRVNRNVYCKNDNYNRNMHANDTMSNDSNDYCENKMSYIPKIILACILLFSHIIITLIIIPLFSK